MPTPQPRRIPFPLGGVHRGFGHADQPEHTTPDAMNVWPSQPTSGRRRGGTRPDLRSVGSVGGAPYHWCDIAWKATGTTQANYVNRQTAVVHASGVSSSATGASWTSRIGVAPGSDFCSVAGYQQNVVMASIGLEKIRYYDLAGASAGNLTDDVVAGTAPTYAGVVWTWAGRLMVAGLKDAPHVVRGSAVGDFLDWDSSSVDLDSSFSLSGGGNTILGEPVVVGFAHNHDCSLVGGPNSCYMIRGNPKGSTGAIYGLSREIGPVSMSAICKADGNTYFMSRVGLAVIDEGCGHAPRLVSDDNIPNELVGVDPGAGDWCAVGYDMRWGMVHVYAHRGSSYYYWVYQTKTRSWWPMSTGNSLRLCASLPNIAGANVASVIAVGSGGSAYTWDRSVTSESMASYVDFTPFNLAESPDDEGLLVKINAELAEDSDDVPFEIYTGESLQEAANAATPRVTGTFGVQGVNMPRRCRLRDKAARVRFKASGGDRLSVESLLATTVPVSTRRPV